MNEMNRIINEELYDCIYNILSNYGSLLDRLGDEFLNPLLADDWNTLARICDEYDSLPIYEERKVEKEEKEEEEHELAVNDRVRVITYSACYPTYSDWIEEYISEPHEKYLWDYGNRCNNGDEGKILFIAPDKWNDTFAYVKMDNGRCYLIEVSGLEKI